MNTQDKIMDVIMDARFGLQFVKNIEDVKIGIAATAYAIKPGDVEKVQISGREMLYNVDWVNKTDTKIIAQEILDIVRPVVTPTEMATIDKMFETPKI